MKKLASILLIILYATTSSGASFHFHFCMGKFQGIGFAAPAKQTCDKCGMNKKGNGNGCCSDVVKTFKAPTDQSSSGVSFDFTQYAHTLPIMGTYSPRIALFHKEPSILYTTGPPKSPLLPLFIRDRNFRI
ncbi:MAG TPA: hypothetical protein VNS58_26725 [Puia sp.]|nr:hypothetical protein [Puia sp.]